MDSSYVSDLRFTDKNRGVTVKQKYMNVELFYKKDGKKKSKTVGNVKRKKGKTIDELVRPLFTDKEWKNSYRIILRYNHTKTDLKKD